MQFSPDPFCLFSPGDSAPIRALRELQLRSLDDSLRRAEQALAFLQRRLAADRELALTLSGTAPGAEQARVWAEYWQQAMRDYTQQAEDLAAEMSAALNPDAGDDVGADVGDAAAVPTVPAARGKPRRG